MMEAYKHAVNAVSSPVTIFVASCVGLMLFLLFPKQLTSKKVAVPVGLLVVAFLVTGMWDEHFRSIMTKPDNVPIVMMLFVFGYFTWYAMYKAVKNDALIAEGKPTFEKTEANDKVLVFPYLIYIEFVAALFYAIVLVVWSIFLKAPLEESANPSLSPNPSKAPWYFLGLQEMLVYFDPWLAGVLFPTLIIVGLCAIPYIDRDKSNSGFYCFQNRKLSISLFMFGFWILWILLIFIGTFLRGPNWNFFGPFEVWDAHKVVPLINVNLSEFIFIKWLGTGLPNNWLMREMPGILIVLFYFTIPPFLLSKTFCKKLYEKLGEARYAIFMFLFLSMMALPIKMILRWAFNLKYIVAIPEFFFNI